MNEAANEIPWGDLGEAWWRATGEQVKASEQQTRFAACRHSGMTRTASAKLAGYSSDNDRARKSGSDAAKSTAVTTLLSLAALEVRARNLPRAPKAPMTREEATAKLSDIARGNDQSLALRAIEALAKNDKDTQSTEIGRFTLLDDGFTSWRTCRDFLRLAGGAVAVASIYTADGAELCGIELLHDVVALLKQADSAFYDRLRGQQSKVSLALLDQRLADPDWQRDARIKLWREVGIEIEDGALANFSAPMNGVDHHMAGA